MAILGLFASCAKPLPAPADEPTGTSELINVIFHVSDEDDTITKVTDITEGNEVRVNRWCVFVFDNESTWFAYRTSTSGNIEISLRAGREYKAYALVNYPTSGVGAFVPSSVTSESDITGKVAYLSDNTVSSLLMYGELSFVPVNTDNDPTSNPGVQQAMAQTEKIIHVSRIVSRIDIQNISVDFSAKPHLAGKTFVLKHIYMTNIYRSSKYNADYLYNNLSSARSAWYNTGGYHRGEQPVAGIDALVSDRDVNATLSTSSHTAKHSFYTFPNQTALSVDQHQMTTWTKRCTRIVLETTLDGTTYYYRINVPEMARNRIYSAVNVVIHGLGSTDPEEDIIPEDVLDVTFTVSTTGWNEEVPDIVEES